MMDKTWRSKFRASKEYQDGVDEFITFAIAHSNDPASIRCPCIDCKNFSCLSSGIVKDHLVVRGIDMTYDPFVLHGEKSRESKSNEEFREENFNYNDTYELLRASYATNTSKEFPGDATEQPGLQKFIDDVEKPLYAGCKKYTKLLAIVKLYSLKVVSGWSDKSFSDLLEIFKDMLPEDNTIPSSTYSARKLLKNFGLDYERIHACVNDCILFRKDHETKDSCPKCGCSRWKVDRLTKKLRVGVPAKVLRYFPIIPRFRRMYMSVGTAKQLRWHSSNHSSDGNMRHPVDTPAWKAIDLKWPTFSDDARNLRLALSADGVNPHCNLSSRYSCWPVMLVTYNLPPWLCMQKKYLMLTLLIPGPKQPGNDIDIYLQPLIDDLLLLWGNGVETYDAYSKTTFMLKAVLMWTINDFPAYGNLAGCSTKGKVACPKCGINTCAEWLKHSKKFSYMGHRRFLRANHPFRLKKSWFNGKQELGKKPITLKGTQVWDEVENIVTDWGKSKEQSKQKKRKSSTQQEKGIQESCVQMWKKRSIFFELPYWKHLLLRHNLDVMHIEKNICESLVGTILNMKGKSKDGIKSRRDLKDLGIRPDLHPKSNGNRTLLPAALHTLSKKEKHDFCERLFLLKLPDGYCSNISNCISMADHSIYGLKSHDCHVLMQQLLPVALRNLLPKGPRHAILRMCLFYNELCQRVIDRDKMESLEDEVAETMCLLERFFPPSFFDIMLHLTIHLVREACLGGPVQFRWMYPFERFMKTLKGYVRNHARPEGCIAECYLVEECVVFSVEHLKQDEYITDQEGRNHDYNDESLILEGRPLLTGTPMTLSEEMLQAAHRCVLFNADEVQPYLEKHQRELILQEPRLGKNEGLLRARHADKFNEWIKYEIANEKMYKPISNTLEWLSFGPRKEAMTYKCYLINGHRFHIKDAEKGNQNSGVSLSATTLCRSSAKDTRQLDQTVTYYGVIREIILLDYHTFRYPIFNCDWANIRSGIKIEEGFTLVNLHQGISEQRDPFILASQAQQVFYSRESIDSNWYAVLRAPSRGFHDLDCPDDELGNASAPIAIASLGIIDDLESDEGSEEYERRDCEGTWIQIS